MEDLRLRDSGRIENGRRLGGHPIDDLRGRLWRELVGLNAIAIYIMTMVVQVSYVWLISFYWMMSPLVARW
jgi:hypothetical protein